MYNGIPPSSRAYQLPPGTSAYPWPPGTSGYAAPPGTRSYYPQTQPPMERGAPREYDPRSDPSVIVRQDIQRFSAPPASNTRVQYIYYDPNDPNFLPPAPPRQLVAPMPAPAPAPLPTYQGPAPAQHTSYLEMPSGQYQFAPGDTYRVVAVEQENVRSVPHARGQYDYGDYSGGHRGYRGPQGTGGGGSRAMYYPGY